MKVYCFNKNLNGEHYKMCSALWPLNLTADDINFLDDDQVHVDAAVARERHAEASTLVSSIEYGSFL